MEENVRYEEARKRVSEIRGFYQHLLAYVVINPVLAVINLLSLYVDCKVFCGDVVPA